MIYINQDNKIVSVKDFRGEEYKVRTFPKDVIIEAVTDDHGYEHLYSFDGINLKSSIGVPAEEYYAMWFFKDGSCTIERRKEKSFVFVSEPWELRSAAKRLNLEFIVN